MRRERVARPAPFFRQFCADRLGKAGSIVAAVRVDERTLAGGDLDTSGKRKNIDDDHHIANRRQCHYALQPPFTADVEFNLVKGHRSPPFC